MPRLALAAFLVAASLAPAFAQDAAPAAAPQITIDPAAAVNQLPRSAQILTGLYATLATLEICAIDIPEPARTGMSAHRRQMEASLSMDEATGTKAYDVVRVDVEKTGVDCSETSTDRQQADAVIAIYNGG
jgi:hypothetical protein